MKVLIIGAARSGTQAAYLLASHHHAVTITDMKQMRNANWKKPEFRSWITDIRNF